MICSAIVEFKIKISKEKTLMWTERVSVGCALLRQGAIPFVETTTSIMTYEDGIAKDANQDEMDTYEKFIKSSTYAQAHHDALLKSERMECEAYEKVDFDL